MAEPAPSRASTQTPPPNAVRATRKARGLSQLELAARVGVSRQSIFAIETGRGVPSVDVALRTAAALETLVEVLFGAGAAAAPPLERRPPKRARALHEAASTLGRGHPSTFGRGPLSTFGRGRAVCAWVGERFVSYAIHDDAVSHAADALGDGRDLEMLRLPERLADNVLIVGCALGLGILADRLNCAAGPGRFAWISRSNSASKAAIERGEAHVAGFHQSTTRGALPSSDTQFQRIVLARWELGFVVAAGNPRRISGADAALRSDLRVVLREPGSGARALSDRLEREGLGEPSNRRARAPAAQRSPKPLSATSHLGVARAVALGAADLGVASHDAAIALGLHFIPIEEERCDLVVPRAFLGDARVKRLLDGLHEAAFRRELSALGHDVSATGTVVPVAA